jgi:hypothetical protein
MASAKTFPRQQPRYRSKFFVVSVILLFASSFISPFIKAAEAIQVAVAKQPAAYPDFTKYPGLLPEFGQLLTRLQHDVQYPPVRNQSRLLPLLPESTTIYFAFPNYGDALHQSRKIFQEELQQSSVLRDWWEHGQPSQADMKPDDVVDQFYQLSKYLGDEIVVSGTITTGTTEAKNPGFLILAEVRKPGLKDFIAQMATELASKSKSEIGQPKPIVRVLTVQDLATAGDLPPAKELVILVRPDFVVGAFDVATLRSLNARLDVGKQQFVSTPFGQRLEQAYAGGAGVLAAADLQKIVRQNQIDNKQNRQAFERSGFEDVKYLVWEHKSVPGQPASQMELSFNGPRHGAASWLAAPAQLGSLDFVSPKAVFSATVVLKNPTEIFEDIKELSASSSTTSSPKPNAFGALATMEQSLHVSLKEDLLRQLGGEITLEMDAPIQPIPVWKVILRVNDSNHLQDTFSKLMTTMPTHAEQFTDGGVTYHILQVPSPQKASKIAYAFKDGYLIIAADRETVAKAIRLHTAGESLAKSERFLAALPLGHSSTASALFYQDPTTMMALRMQQAQPEIAEFLSKLTTDGAPTATFVYANEDSIHEASAHGGMDIGAVLVGAAIAIPNLLRAKAAANEASAVYNVRTINVGQRIYSNSYPAKRYASNLATLGADPRTGNVSANHAGLIDSTLGNASCTTGAWCTKAGFRFSLIASCKQQLCSEYVVVGTPLTSSEGSKSFCSTSDALVRFKIGPPLNSPIDASECLMWPPVR